MQTNFHFRREFEGGFRAWHWLMALCVFVLLATGLLRETYLNSGKNGKVIAAKMIEQNITIDEKVAKDIAKTIRDPMWQWHNYFGFGLLGVMVLGIYVKRNLKSSCPMNRAKEAISALKEASDAQDKKTLREFAFIKISHSLFFLLLTVMLLSGFALYFREFLGFPKAILGVIKETHEIGLWFVLLFVLAHIAGVVRKEITSEHGLISSIIGGK